MKLHNINNFTYIIKIDNPGNFNIKHPAGHVLTNNNLANFIKPLLEFQPYINSVEIVKHDINHNNFINEYNIINLDMFRTVPCNFSASYIPKYYFYMLPYLKYDSIELSKPAIIAEKDERANNKILIFRSSRYHNNLISYKFLEKYKDKIIFIGLYDEFLDFTKTYFSCEYIKVNNALEAANLINSAELVIGNQTFLFAIAELLKVPRLLEQCHYCPNVITLGGFSQDIIFQQQFESLITNFYNEK